MCNCEDIGSATFPGTCFANSSFSLSDTTILNDEILAGLFYIRHSSHGMAEHFGWAGYGWDGGLINIEKDSAYTLFMNPSDSLPFTTDYFYFKDSTNCLNQ